MWQVDFYKNGLALTLTFDHLRDAVEWIEDAKFATKIVITQIVTTETLLEKGHL